MPRSESGEHCIIGQKGKRPAREGVNCEVGLLGPASLQHPPEAPRKRGFHFPAYLFVFFCRPRRGRGLPRAAAGGALPAEGSSCSLGLIEACSAVARAAWPLTSSSHLSSSPL